MADSGDGSRRDRTRPEDNPFIAFRRFADSQASALLNTVFTLPATLANFNNAHHAREQCLFGHADPHKCKALLAIETHEATVRSEGRELYRVGDMQAVLNKGEELIKLEQQADELRKDIVEEARSRDAHVRRVPGQADRLERSGSDKGQRWGWSWNWGFPQSFGQENTSAEPEEELEQLLELLMRLHNEDEGNQSTSRMAEEQGRHNPNSPRARSWSWSWSWPPPADATNREHITANERPYDFVGELRNMFEEASSWKRDRYQSLYDSSYSPGVLEKSKELEKSGVQWRDAFEDLMRAEKGAPLIPTTELGRSKDMAYNHWERRLMGGTFNASPMTTQKSRIRPDQVTWDGEPDEANDEPSYEYEHDHEDQHDDPPTPKTEQGNFDSAGDTELDAYERLLSPMSVWPEASRVEKVSVLSTLTTTERTVAPDGSVTTKVVLKKRFADGREESSETVHTQRGQDIDASTRDPWETMQKNQMSRTSKNGNEELAKDETGGKRAGWFWSS